MPACRRCATAGTIAEPGKKAKQQRDALAEAIRAVIADAIAAGGSSLRDYVQTDGSLGYFQHSFSVYDREGEACPSPAAAAISSASCRAGVRPSIAGLPA